MVTLLLLYEASEATQHGGLPAARSFIVTAIHIYIYIYIHTLIYY